MKATPVQDNRSHPPRQRVRREEIVNTVRQIVEHFRPLKVILFGSYAYGTPVDGSDVDMLVVTDTPLKETQQAVEICQAIHYDFGLDLIVRTPHTITERIKLGDPFMLEIIEKGKVLYESADDRMGE